ncbi:hypothetical protein F5050DRAFT_1874360 [Lentinula boryana]|uniref:Uncharacterized protein n=1 Tax=Lentinula boryana TaxID=40481 RepID=A0ABQ8PYA0_9AGAR|nr:hypothetical protein F5050DRAFT_1874360 [Lentinula boryana]
MLPSRTIVLYLLLALLNMGVRRSFLLWALPMCYNPCGIDRSSSYCGAYRFDIDHGIPSSDAQAGQVVMAHIIKHLTMANPFEYSYNPEATTFYHSQASNGVYTYEMQHQPHQPQTSPARDQSSPGTSHHRSEIRALLMYLAHHIAVNTNHLQYLQPLTRRDPHETILFPSGSMASFPRPQPAINAQWVLQNPGCAWDASVPPPLQLLYLPSSPENSGYTSEQPIHFTSHGLPGPHIRDILSKCPTLDDPEASVFENFGWKRIQWTFDVRDFPYAYTLCISNESRTLRS